MNAIGKAPAAGGAAAETTADQTVTPWLAVVSAVILLSGAPFGYDQGVISGALHGIRATSSHQAAGHPMPRNPVSNGAVSLGAQDRRAIQHVTKHERATS